MKKTTNSTRLRGQSLVEWALILPALLLLLMVIVDLGRVTYTFSALTNSTREGARYGTIHPADLGGVASTVRHFAIGLDPDLITVTTDQPTTRTVRVATTYQFAVVTPFVSSFWGSETVTLRSQTTMRIEQ
jgi:Flp pilus assembly protein TadG